ncbi:MAG: DUF308 domain-containing protein [Bradyrhizobiaceae bacterium]|nr:DUF308 domain-containing protein [Bradyrhizobiaceae bacterium]
MAHQSSTADYHTGGTAWWAYALLGIAFLIAGFVVLGNVVAATIVSAFIFGIVLLVAGAFEIFHAFYAKGWGGVLYSLIIGVLYMLGGWVLVSNPVSAIFPLTLAFGALLFASGLVRLMLAFRYWADYGWLLLFSGLIAIAAAVIIISGWPVSGLWVIGFFVGIDLLLYGFWWIVYAFEVRRHA